MNLLKHIPNTITSMNLLCGAIGVICTFQGRMDIAFPLMIAAAAADFCDGLSARLLGAYSDIGKELDSLADDISFGLLPAMMLHKTMADAGCSTVPGLIPLLIAAFSALRLAKFNIDERQHSSFLGLPTPACAMVCGSLAYFVAAHPGSVLASLCGTAWFIPAVSIVLSALLVCEIPMFAMKFGKGTSSDRVTALLRVIFLAIVFIMAIAAVFTSLDWSLAVFFAFSGYILLNLAAAPFTKRQNS